MDNAFAMKKNKERERERERKTIDNLNIITSEREDDSVCN